MTRSEPCRGSWSMYCLRDIEEPIDFGLAILFMHVNRIFLMHPSTITPNAIDSLCSATGISCALTRSCDIPQPVEVWISA